MRDTNRVGQILASVFCRYVFGILSVNLWGGENMLFKKEKPEEDNRKIISKVVLLSERENEMLRKLAAYQGRNMSDYIRYEAIIKPYRKIFGE